MKLDTLYLILCLATIWTGFFLCFYWYGWKMALVISLIVVGDKAFEISLNRRTEMKKSKLLAPALVKHWNNRKPDKESYYWAISGFLFESQEEAENAYLATAVQPKIIWPVIPNKDGFYEIEE